MKRPVLWVLLLLAGAVSTTAGQTHIPPHGQSRASSHSQASEDQPMVFKSTIDLVSVTAIARDENGRPVKGLRKNDFVVLEKGQPRPIVDFTFSDAGEISLTILFDSSGSMRQPAQLEAGRQVVKQVLSWIKPRVDEVSLYSFDKELRQEVDFTKNPDEIRDALGGLEPMGSTSLYDAVADAARESASRPSPRRAVIVVTDGIDTSSTMTAAEVSSLASSIDVPVYVIAVVNPIDHPGTERGGRRRGAGAGRHEPDEPRGMDRRRHRHRQHPGAHQRRGPDDHHGAAPPVSAGVRSLARAGLVSARNSRRAEEERPHPRPLRLHRGLLAPRLARATM